MLLGALVVVSVASVLIGSRWIPATTIFDTSDPLHAIVTTRIDRTLLGLVIGGALGMVGALMQGLTRNPLADPGILGINAGAAFAMVLAISTFGVSDLRGYVWFGFAGAAAAMAVVHVVAALGRDGSTPMKVAIAGAARHRGSRAAGPRGCCSPTGRPSSLIGSGRSAPSVAGPPTSWRSGCRSWSSAACSGSPPSAASTPWRSATTSPAGLGRRVGLDRAVIGVAVVLLAGTATALAGPIAFVGLIVPHGVRAVVGADYRRWCRSAWASAPSWWWPPTRWDGSCFLPRRCRSAS